jgi:hypothetical protein
MKIEEKALNPPMNADEHGWFVPQPNVPRNAFQALPRSSAFIGGCKSFMLLP